MRQERRDALVERGGERGVEPEGAVESRYELLVSVATAAAVVSLAAIWVLAAILWPMLPERIPVHFGIDGTPDRFADKSAGVWFALPAVATGLALLFFLIEKAIVRMAERRPKSLNVPRKAEFVALPEEARLRALRPMTALLRGTVASVTAIFAFMLWATYEAASGGEVRGVTFIVGTFGGVAVAVGWTAFCLVALTRAVRDEKERAEQTDQSGGASPG